MAASANAVRPDDLLTVRDMAMRYPNLGTVATFRWQIFNETNNGLAEAGAVVRRGGKVFIVVPRYLDWVLGRDQQGRAA